jgi:hypothetical protein
MRLEGRLNVKAVSVWQEAFAVLQPFPPYRQPKRMAGVRFRALAVRGRFKRFEDSLIQGLFLHGRVSGVEVGVEGRFTIGQQ